MKLPADQTVANSPTPCPPPARGGGTFKCYRVLEHKPGECIWWLMVLADRMNLESGDALEKFLAKTEEQLTRH